MIIYQVLTDYDLVIVDGLCPPNFILAIVSYLHSLCFKEVISCTNAYILFAVFTLKSMSYFSSCT